MALLAALVPPGVVTVIFPLVPPAGAVAVSEVAEVTLVIAPAIPLNKIAEAFKRLVPVMVMGDPKIGVKPVTVGAGGITVKLAADVTDPAGVVIVSGPVVAPVGTFIVSDTPVVATVGTALVPLNETLVAPNKFVPVIVTVAPTRPEVGEMGVFAAKAAGK